MSSLSAIAQLVNPLIASVQPILSVVKDISSIVQVIAPDTNSIESINSIDNSAKQFVIILASSPLSKDETHSLEIMGKIHVLTKEDVYNSLSDYSGGHFTFLIVDFRNETLFNWLSHQVIDKSTTCVFGHVYFFEKENCSWESTFSVDRLLQTIPKPQPNLQMFIQALSVKKAVKPPSLPVQVLKWFLKKFQA
jgi:hypothetical protein